MRRARFLRIITLAKKQLLHKLGMPITAVTFIRRMEGLAACLAVCIFLTTLFFSGFTRAEESSARTVQKLWDEWAIVVYILPDTQKGPNFADLLPSIDQLIARHPNEAGPLLLKGVVMASFAISETNFVSLERLKESRQALEASIAINPNFRDGAAYLTLGNLYYQIFGWPVSFGSKKRALEYYQKAYEQSPDAIDTNFYFARFYLDQGKIRWAGRYLDKANIAPIRSEHHLADMALKKDIVKALSYVKTHKEPKYSLIDRFIDQLFRFFSSPS